MYKHVNASGRRAREYRAISALGKPEAKPAKVRLRREGHPVRIIGIIPTDRPTKKAPKKRPQRVSIAPLVIGGAILWAISAHAETLHCSASFQGYRICQGPDGYRSFEWDNGGYTYGDDNNRNRWMTIPGRWGDTVINRRDGQ